MADAVFRVAADVAEYITGMARADAATKKVARSAASIGDQVGASVVKIELLNRALNAAGRAISGVMDKATSSAATAGERGMAMASSLESLGVRDILGQTKKLTGGGGLASADENAAFAKNLARTVKARGYGFKQGEAEKILGAFSAQGAFGAGEGGEDFLEGVSSGTSIDSILEAGNKRFATIASTALGDPNSALSQGVKAKMVNEMARAAEEKSFLVSGTSEIAQRAEARRKMASDPGGPVGIVGNALGETAGTVVSRGLDAINGDNAAARATERANERLLQTIRKGQTVPTFSPNPVQ